MNYHCDVLEAKIVLGESLVVSIGSEFIENNRKDAQSQERMGEEERNRTARQKPLRGWQGS